MTSPQPFDWSRRKPITALTQAAQPSARNIEALTRELDRTQWLARPELEILQFQQLATLAKHFEKTSPAFRERLAAAGLTAGELSSPEALRRLPVLSRRDLRNGCALDEHDIPKTHLPSEDVSTSGSTGEPVVVRRTSVNALFWYALTLREMFWHQMPVEGRRFTTIRATNAKPIMLADWGPPIGLFFETGAAQVLPITADIAQQVRWLREFQPNILLVYPSVLAAMEDLCRQGGIALPSLTLIQTVGETLPPHIREAAAATFKCKVIDNYSSQEAGVVALRCAESDLYHVMDEALIVEVLGADGHPCPPGEAGRAVITDLRNVATPLIRYAIGDHVVPGERCPCGRGLSTLQKVVGRERNLVAMPNGTRHWPLVGFAKFREAAPVLQYQFVQEQRGILEMRLVVERALTDAEENALRDIVRNALGHPFEIRFCYFENALPRGAAGKFEEFVSRIQS